MKKIDGRTVDRKALEHIRRTAVRRVADGESVTDVMRSYGFERTAFYKWKRAFEQGGEEALLSRTATGRPSKLSDRQKQQVRRWMTGKDPRQHGFDFGLWTRSIVASLVEQRFGVQLGVTAVGRLLAELGITPQKPLRRAYERDPAAVEHWTREEFPAIRARAEARGAEIFFEDEAGVRSDPVLGRTWAPKGKTPVVPTSGQRQQVNAISAVNARGAFWFDVYTGMLNATRFVAFLKKFLRGRRRPVVLVVDGHPSHKAKVVRDFVASTKGRLELVFLPPYAPDLNPDEFVWNHVKKQGVSKKPLRKNESLRRRVESDLAHIKSKPALVRSFFRAPSVSYVVA